MKQFLLVISVFTALSYQFRVWADEDDEPKKKTNSVKAILATDKEKGFKLSDSAIRRLNISYQTLREEKIFKIPDGAVVYHESETGVYVFKDGWFKLIDVDIEKTIGKYVIIKSSILVKGSQIVISGVSLLRVAELDAFGGTRDMD